MSSPKRTERLNGEIHAILANALRTEVKDPRITPLTITGVRVSGDLGVATVYFTPLGGQGDRHAIIKGLRAATGFLRREIGAKLRLSRVPELVFSLDDGVDEAVRLTNLLTRMEEEDDRRQAEQSSEVVEEETL